MKNLINKFWALSKRDKIVITSIVGIIMLVLVWVLLTWSNIINNNGSSFDNKESLAKLGQFKKINEEQSKTVSIKEISDEKKSKLWLSIESTLAAIDINAKQYNDSIMAQMKVASSTKDFNLASFQKNVKDQNNKFKTNKEKLIWMKALLSWTGTLIINKDLELAILKQINEVWMESKIGLAIPTSSGATLPVIQPSSLSWVTNSWSIKNVKN